jgi:hypothetical protein
MQQYVLLLGLVRNQSFTVALGVDAQVKRDGGPPGAQSRSAEPCQSTRRQGEGATQWVDSRT